MNEKVEQLRTLVSALENGEPVADQLQALGAERLQQLRTELEEQIQQSKETGGTVLPEKLATMEGLRGLMTDLIHGTLQSYFMDTLLDTHEERLRTVQTAPEKQTTIEPKRRKGTVSAFDTPPQSAPEKKTAPKQNAFQRFLAGASIFFGGILGSIKGFFSSWFPKKETPSRPYSPETSESSPKTEIRTPTEIYEADPEIAPPARVDPVTPLPTIPSSSATPSGGTELPDPEIKPEASGGRPVESQNLLATSVQFEGKEILLSNDETFSLVINGTKYALSVQKFGVEIPLKGKNLRENISAATLDENGLHVSLANTNSVNIAFGTDAIIDIAPETLHTLIEAALASDVTEQIVSYTETATNRAFFIGEPKRETKTSESTFILKKVP